MKQFFSSLGMDRAVVYTLVGRGWGVFSGLATLSLIVVYLTRQEQGYYYTFASLLAMQVLFELGMAQVLMQFSSHEMAHLAWTSEGIIEGDAQAKGRLRSLLVLMSRWYGAVAVLMVLGVLPAGWWFFTTNPETTGVEWQLAWIWVVLAAAVNIFFMPFLALLEGCGLVTEVARLRVYQNIMGSMVAWVVLLDGGGLMAMPAMNTGMAISVIVWLWFSKKRFLRDMLWAVDKKSASIDWKAEIWPMQWRIALSWLSGYFIFQLFTPVMFMYRGAEEAGQMGLSFTFANALMSIAMAWMGTRSPRFGSLVAQRNYPVLDRLFKITLQQSLSVMCVLGVLLCITNYLAHANGTPYAMRLLDPLPFFLLIVATILNYVVYAQATYLRAHKQEPFLPISLMCAALITIFTLVFAKEYGASGVMGGYLGVCAAVGLGWGSKVFFIKRREWRQNATAATEIGL